VTLLLLEPKGLKKELFELKASRKNDNKYGNIDSYEDGERSDPERGKNAWTS
jgi:hypothetical protein